MKHSVDYTKQLKKESFLSKKKQHIETSIPAVRQLTVTWMSNWRKTLSHGYVHTNLFYSHDTKLLSHLHIHKLAQSRSRAHCSWHSFCLPPPVFMLQGQHANSVLGSQIVFLHRHVHTGTCTHSHHDLPASVASRYLCWKGGTNPGWQLCALRAATKDRARQCIRAKLSDNRFISHKPHTRPQSCRCSSVRTTDHATKPGARAHAHSQWCRKVWTHEAKPKHLNWLREKAIHICADVRTPRCPRANAHPNTRHHPYTLMQTQAHIHLFCFAFLPSSCIRCRQKVRFLRQPGILLRSRRRGRAADE